MTIANAMVKSKRIMNLPAAIPTNHHQKLPPKSAEPATARSAQTAILYLVFIAVIFLSFMRILEVRELSFIFLSAFCESDIFFMRLSVGSVVFVSGAFKRCRV